MLTAREAYLQMGRGQLASLSMERLVVVESLDAPRVSLSRTGDAVSYWRRGERVGLTDRVLNPHLSIPFSMRPPVDEGVVYEVAYFGSTEPVTVSYPTAPVGRAVLLSKRPPGAPVVMDNRIRGDALSMGAEPPPVLYEGALNADYARHFASLMGCAIRDGLNPWDVVESLGLRPAFATPWLGSYGGLLLELGNKGVRVRVPHAGLVVSRAAELLERESIDMYGIVMSDFAAFCDTEVDVSALSAAAGGSTLEEKALGAASALYLAYVRSRRGTFDECVISEMDLPVDPSLVSGEVLETFSVPNNQKIFRMVVGALHKPKKRPTGTVTESLLLALEGVRARLRAGLARTHKTKWPTFEEYLVTKA